MVKRVRIHYKIIQLSLLFSISLFFIVDNASAYTIKFQFPDGKPVVDVKACIITNCDNTAKYSSGTGQVVFSDNSIGQQIAYDRYLFNVNAATKGSSTILGGETTITLPRILPSLEPSMNPVELDFFNKINYHRTQLGLSPIYYSEVLATAADYQAYWLYRRNAGLDPNHTGEFGTGIISRAAEASNLEQLTSVTEIAAHNSSNDKALAGLLGSPAHRASIENPGQKRMGVAIIGNYYVAVMSIACKIECSGTPPIPVPDNDNQANDNQANDNQANDNQANDNQANDNQTNYNNTCKTSATARRVSRFRVIIRIKCITNGSKIKIKQGKRTLRNRSIKHHYYKSKVRTKKNRRKIRIFIYDSNKQIVYRKNIKIRS